MAITLSNTPKKTMLYKSFYRSILMGLVLTAAFPSIRAEPVLRLVAQPVGEIGQSVTAALNITDSTSLSGFNAHIVLPAGLDLIAVNKGSLLSSDAITLDYNESNQDLKVIAYSATEEISQTGELLILSLQINHAATPGLLDLAFSEINSNPLINSKHALANKDGLVSLTHTVENTQILIYNATSDHDNDGLPDAWEISFGLNPLNQSDALLDTDNDGISNRDEFLAGTNPNEGSTRDICSLDADGNETVDALTDGLLFIRHMFGLANDSLIDNAVGDGCNRCTASEIESFLNQCAVSVTSDIDGNGDIDALTDGVLNIRFMFGLKGAALIDNAVKGNCTRCTASEIESYLQGLKSPD